MILLVTGAVAGLVYAGLAGVVRALRWLDETAADDEGRCACRRWTVHDREIRAGGVWHSRHRCSPSAEVIR